MIRYDSQRMAIHAVGWAERRSPTFMNVGFALPHHLLAQCNICRPERQRRNDPEIINDDPYEAGWLLRLKDFDMEAYHALLDAASHEDMTAGD